MPARQAFLVDLLQQKGKPERTGFERLIILFEDKHIGGICHILHGRHVSNLQLTLTCRVFLLNVPNCEGTNGNYLVEPNSALLGSLRRTKEQICAYNVTNRDCVPLGTWDLKKGTL